ncbi:hypothetical protein VTO73DRAFT_10763 [Trametes versicolor]
MDSLNTIERELAVLRENAQGPAFAHVERCLNEMEEMDGNYGADDCYAAVELLVARVETFLVLANGERELAPLLRRAEDILRTQHVDPGLLSHFQRRLYTVTHEHDERTCRATQLRLAVLRSRAQAVNQVLLRVGPSGALARIHNANVSAVIRRMDLELARELAALDEAQRQIVYPRDELERDTSGENIAGEPNDAVTSAGDAGGGRAPGALVGVMSTE